MLYTLAFPQTKEVTWSILPMGKLIIRKDSLQAPVLFTYLSHMKLVFPLSNLKAQD